MRFEDIPQFPQSHYQIHVSWGYVEDTLELWGGDSRGGLNLSPDYQREHVWTRQQQIAYIEYALMGGEVGKTITWNSPDWGGTYERPTELVDGKQRLEAVRAFLRGDIRAFNTYFKDFEDRLPTLDPNFIFRVCKLPSRAAVLQLYLNINAGGTPHTQEELEKVRQLLRQEREND